MSSVVNVAFHASQFPQSVQLDLLDSLRSRQVNHKFHYDSVKQTQKWLALHEAYSPARTDEDCLLTYDRAFAGAVKVFPGQRVHLVGLGCGGGQKDTRLLQSFAQAGKEVAYSPVDVSAAMVLVARQAAASVVVSERCFPFVCDLATAGDLSVALTRPGDESASRLVTFFGMMPNFEPDAILPRLSELVRTGDTLLCSANLAPGPDHAEGLRKVLSQYDNELTRDWLMTFLLDVGVVASDGELRFNIEKVPGIPAPGRIAAYFHFGRQRNVRVGKDCFEFRPGEAIRLFFSYRHTPSAVAELLAAHGLRVQDQWVTVSQEEGVFLCVRG